MNLHTKRLKKMGWPKFIHQFHNSQLTVIFILAYYLLLWNSNKHWACLCSLNPTFIVFKYYLVLKLTIASDLFKWRTVLKLSSIWVFLHQNWGVLLNIMVLDCFQCCLSLIHITGQTHFLSNCILIYAIQTDELPEEFKEVEFQINCKYWNRGFCKNRDGCKWNHSEGDCEDYMKGKKCYRRHCHKRHRKACKYWR